MKVLCFDIGGTDTKYGVIENEQILQKGTFPTHSHLSQLEMSQKLVDMVKKIQQNHSIDGIGISCAGGIDFANAVVVTAPDALPRFQGWDFRQTFLAETGLYCVADNDVNCFAIAEGRSGIAKGCQTFLTMTIGTGIGGGLVVNGKIWRGMQFNAGEIGRMLMNNVKYESLASTSALVRRAQQVGLIVDNGVQIYSLYDQKNPLAIQVVEESYADLVTGMINLIYILNPEMIVIGGGVSNRATFVTEVTERIEKRINPSFKGNTQIKTAYYRNDGGMMGAYYNYVDLRKVRE